MHQSANEYIRNGVNCIRNEFQLEIKAENYAGRIISSLRISGIKKEKIMN